MATRSLTFHLPVEANPSVILAIVDAWLEQPERAYDSTKALMEDVQLRRDVPPRTEPVDFAARLGLVQRTPGGLVLSPLARVLAAQSDTVRHDLLHFLACTRWTAGADDECVPFWSYRSTCNALWEMAPISLEAERTRLVEYVIGASHEAFGSHPSFNPERISYSDKSLRAIRKWLECLTPPVLTGGEFQRRAACSSQLILLALGAAYQEAGAVPGVELLLTGRLRESICRLCLLDPPYLDRLLDWALARHQALVARADRSGSYGRAVRLLAIPTVEAVASV